MSEPLPRVPGRRLGRRFFARPALEVAESLLGQRLVRIYRGKRLSGRVVETEAYVGESDTACHASRGRTERNAPLYGPPGTAYVYFTYGMHWLFNVVCEREGFPAAVLIRALEPEEGIETQRRLRGGRALRDLTSGPAKLTQALAIDGRFNRVDLVTSAELFFERAPAPPAHDIATAPRVGIDYASRVDREAHWRYYLKGSPFVSKVRPRGK